MANMDDIAREQQHRDAMGYTELHREIERMRMTLRDQFAMAALTGQMAIPDERAYPQECGLSVEDWRSGLILQDVRFCYQVADTAMKVRSE